MIAFVAAVLGLVAGGAAASGDYFIQADIVRGAEGQPKGPVCVPNSVFLVGESLVFRIQVYDAESGAKLDAGMIEDRGIEVAIQIGEETIAPHFGPHPPGHPEPISYWTTHWIIPDDYPAGVVAWSVQVSDATGRSGEFEPIGQAVGLPNLMIVPGPDADGGQA